MATTQSHPTDFITSDEQPANLDIMKEQANNEISASFKSSQEPAAVVLPTKVAPLSGPNGLTGDFAGYLPSIILSPQAQGFYYRGYENPTGNVHKSIKYNVRASTVNGNKKLDAAYREAKDEKEQPCPVFLLFSVNASSQFGGVAEMIGHVDFEKRVDYWQQDKWSGQFPVKWAHHKRCSKQSVPPYFIGKQRQYKPVTNSPVTQEAVFKIYADYTD